MSFASLSAPALSSGGQPIRWSRTDYHKLAELGLLLPERRYELIAGEIIAKIPQNYPHSATVLLLPDVLAPVFQGVGHVRPQVPVALSTDGEPEPDSCIVRGRRSDYRAHPTEEDILLLIEVSDTTLGYDLGRKAAYYAEAGVGDYWVLDVNRQELHVHRNPAPDPLSPWGFRYRHTQTLAPDDGIAPLAVPSAVLPVRSLFP